MGIVNSTKKLKYKRIHVLIHILLSNNEQPEKEDDLPLNKIPFRHKTKTS